jgi:hypothetical protein
MKFASPTQRGTVDMKVIVYPPGSFQRWCDMKPCGEIAVVRPGGKLIFSAQHFIGAGLNCADIAIGNKEMAAGVD